MMGCLSDLISSILFLAFYPTVSRVAGSVPVRLTDLGLQATV